MGDLSRKPSSNDDDDIMDDFARKLNGGNWKTCNHVWGPQQSIRDADFGVTFGSIQVCKICKARLHHDYTTPIGTWQSDSRVLPPEAQ